MNAENSKLPKNLAQNNEFEDLNRMRNLKLNLNSDLEDLNDDELFDELDFEEDEPIDDGIKTLNDITFEEKINDSDFYNEDEL